MRFPRRTLSFLLSAVLAALGPGLAPYTALAAEVAPANSAGISGSKGIPAGLGRTGLAPTAIELGSLAPAESVAPLQLSGDLPAVVSQEPRAAAAVKTEASEAVRIGAPAAKEVQAISRQVGRAMDAAGPAQEASPEAAGGLGRTLIGALTGEAPSRPASDPVVPAEGALGGFRPGLAQAAKKEPRWGGIILPAPALAAAAFTLSGAFTALPLPMQIAVYALIILPSLVLHEIGHARVADRLGDPWPTLAGRTSLRLKDMWRHKDAEEGKVQLTHLDPWWTLWLPVLLLAYSHIAHKPPMIFGMARPVRIHPKNMVDPEKGITRDKAVAIVSLAGPLVNFALALGFGLLHAGVGLLGTLVPGLPLPGFLLLGLELAVFFNVMLGLFNLVPLAPLDGHHVARSLISDGLGRRALAERYFGPASPPAPGALIIRFGADRRLTENIDWDEADGSPDGPEALAADYKLERQLEAVGLSWATIDLYALKPVAADRGINAVLLRPHSAVSPEFRAYWTARGIVDIPGFLGPKEHADLIGRFDREVLKPAGLVLYLNDAKGFKAFLQDVPGAADSALGKKLDRLHEWNVIRPVHWFALIATVAFLSQAVLLPAVEWASRAFLFGKEAVWLAVPAAGAVAGWLFLRRLLDKRK